MQQLTLRSCQHWVVVWQHQNFIITFIIYLITINQLLDYITHLIALSACLIQELDSQLKPLQVVVCLILSKVSEWCSTGILYISHHICSLCMSAFVIWYYKNLYQLLTMLCLDVCICAPVGVDRLLQRPLVKGSRAHKCTRTRREGDRRHGAMQARHSGTPVKETYTCIHISKMYTVYINHKHTHTTEVFLK